MKTPLAIFAYRRSAHLGQCLTALARCARLDACAVTIFCDGPRADSERAEIDAVREVACAWAREHGAEVREAPRNLGLAGSIVGGVTDLCGAHGRAIVLEDDLEPAPDFLRYMLAALDRYESEPRAMQIAGFRFPYPWPGKDDAAFMPCVTTWGWATWARAWQHFRWEPAEVALLDDAEVARAFDLDGAYPYAQTLRNRVAGRNDSWGILWWWAVFRARGQVLYPRESLISVGGFDGSGTHCASGDGLVAGQSAGRFPAEAARWPSAVESDSAAFAALGEHLRRAATPQRGTSWWRRALTPITARAAKSLSHP
jgi:GT2 family glycosyltransferase